MCVCVCVCVCVCACVRACVQARACVCYFVSTGRILATIKNVKYNLYTF